MNNLIPYTYIREDGWVNAHPEWSFTSIDYSENLYLAAAKLNWIANNIENYEENCRWRALLGTLTIRFKNEKDCIWFNLACQ